MTNFVKLFRTFLYDSGLSLLMLGLFLVFVAGQSVTGHIHYNEELEEHGQAGISVLEYVGSSQFWFESFQNWQSEFLSVGILLILSVYLRQRGSPESKPVGTSDEKTGS